jgi:hypothetical protein
VVRADAAVWAEPAVRREVPRSRSYFAPQSLPTPVQTLLSRAQAALADTAAPGGSGNVGGGGGAGLTGHQTQIDGWYGDCSGTAPGSGGTGNTGGTGGAGSGGAGGNGGPSFALVQVNAGSFTAPSWTYYAPQPGQGGGPWGHGRRKWSCRRGTRGPARRLGPSAFLQRNRSRAFSSAAHTSRAEKTSQTEKTSEAPSPAEQDGT